MAVRVDDHARALEKGRAQRVDCREGEHTAPLSEPHGDT